MSNKKRKDKTGALFRKNEGQRKDGRYYYRHTDEQGNVKFLYGKTLKELREKEDELNRNIQRGINIQASMMTVSELLDLYMELHKDGIKYSTYLNYLGSISTIKKSSLGKVKIKDVTVSAAKHWVVVMYESNMKYSVGTIRGFVTVLKLAFDMAYEDDMVIKNPFTFSVRRLLPKEERKTKVIKEADYQAFIRFLAEDKTYSRMLYPVILAHETGLRIGEICGLTVDDIDFDNQVLYVNKQVVLGPNNSTCVGTPKSAASYREVPLSAEAMRVLKIVVEDVKTRKTNPCIDGKIGFIFTRPRGKAQISRTMCGSLKEAVAKYRRNVDPKFPTFTFHGLRHTFCTRMNARGVNLKSSQYIMGHSKADITANVYTHTNSSDAIADYRSKFV